MENNSVVNLRSHDAQETAAAPAGLRRLDAKMLTLAELAAQAQRARADGRKVVLCHGTFDLLHIGHIRHLQRARHEGDVLIVTVTADAYVNKGPGRPAFTHDLRAENLAALIKTLNAGKINNNQAKEVLSEMFATGKTAPDVIKEKGFEQISDVSTIDGIIDQVIAGNAPNVESYRGGNEKLFGFFVGQVMRASQGKANPGIVNERLRIKLEGE